jgi:hypothetical protein
MIDLGTIDQLTGGRLGTFDVVCPSCGPMKRTLAKQRKKTLRIWRLEEAFASYHCTRCGEAGYARDRNSSPPDPVKLAKVRAEAAARDRALWAERLDKAQWLWSQRRPIVGTIAEVYLRQARGYGGPLPPTLGFLPTRGDYPPAMIAAFGLAHEIEPGVIAIADSAVTGVHLTRLQLDGSGKAGDPAKIMVGFSTGSPIVLAPPNDLLGLAVTEGIENGLSVHEITGLGVWAAGAASRMPALAAAVPAYIDFTTIVADDDEAGRRFATELAAELERRGLAALVTIPKEAAV